MYIFPIFSPLQPRPNTCKLQVLTPSKPYLPPTVLTYPPAAATVTKTQTNVTQETKQLGLAQPKEDLGNSSLFIKDASN